MKTKLNKKIIVSFLIGVLIVGSFLVLYNQKPENVSISEFLSNKLGGITGFAVITHNTSTNWTGTFNYILLNEVTKVI